jgi:hypothetical protein
MGELKKYRRRPGTAVVAVRLDLETDGFSYFKWGASQRCKAGDWIVNNAGDTYTVDADSFAQTYREQSPGQYAKTGHVFAERAAAAGSMTTKEGSSTYQPGDMLVYNDTSRRDGYAMSALKFDELYEPDDT